MPSKPRNLTDQRGQIGLMSPNQKDARRTPLSKQLSEAVLDQSVCFAKACGALLLASAPPGAKRKRTAAMRMPSPHKRSAIKHC